MSKRLLPLLAGAVGVVFAFGAPAHAAPTAACIWNGLTVAQRSNVEQVIGAGAEMPADLRAAAQQASERCGFEAGLVARQRASFLLAMSVYRARLETMIAERGGVTPASLDRAYTRMPRAFHSQLVAFAGERFNNRMPPPPDETRFRVMLADLRLRDDPASRSILQNYLVVRAAAEYAERQGQAFRVPYTPPPEPAPAPEVATPDPIHTPAPLR